MIISDLCDEYAVLVSQNKAPVYGYDNVNVPYGLVINDDGILVEVRLLGDFSGKKPINKISVPARFVKTSGIVPDFLCGNAEYMLGYNTEKPEHAVKAFQACAQLHMQILEGIDDPVASAVRAFFLQGPQWEISGLYSSETQSNGLDEKTIKDATCALAQGRRYDYEGIRLNPDEHFHILALSPNKSRLAIRFYLTDTFGVFAHNIEQYYQDTEIRRPRYDKTGFLPILRLLGQTIRKQRKDENAPVKKQKKKSAIENVSSEMVSAIMQAILNGTPYPVTLINVVERRINVERDVPPDKAAIIKAYYLRKTTNEQFKEVLQMDINEESEYLPYVLGRIFSIYEQIQLGAIPNINTTIKDKYFTSASTTPARIFPILGDLAAKHMRKAWKSEGLKIKLDKVLGTLTQKVGDHYPSRLSLEERGAFQLGYYFENQKRFNKTNKSNEDNEQGENND